MIDSRLQTLRVLNEEKTITAAAAVLHLSPSSVSQQLRQLSADLGIELLEHYGRNVRLTAAARTLLGHAHTLFAQWERACGDLAMHREGEAGELRVSGVATALASVVAPAVAKLRGRYPQMSFHLGEDPDEDRFHLLLMDRTDIAVVIPASSTPAPDDERFEQHPLLEEPQDLLVPTGHPFAGSGSVALADAAGEDWLRAGDPRDQHQLFVTACASAGFAPRVRHGAVDWSAVAALVAQGFGICLVPRLAAVPDSFGVVRVRLHGEPTPVRKVVACVRRGSSAVPTIARGLDALREAASDWQLSAGSGRRWHGHVSGPYG
ncbi:LysR family transcriptional regulator [Streptomyces sp. NPDC050610]|uniref:LysR family transcriptional regulator n=1 Tax=Streptomyces sp. NPDC050610 TaxID=3157097 RepID=UPI003438696D